MNLILEDALRVVRNGGSLRVKASSYAEAELHRLAQNLAEKAVIHIVMDKNIRIEDIVQIATSAKGTVLFDLA